MNNREELRKEAHRYRELGLCPIPLNGKVPCVAWAEFQERVATEQEIDSWSTLSNLTGIGIVTGEHYGIFVLDVDKGAEMSGLQLPPTPAVTTGGGGHHYYFKYPQGVKVGCKTGIYPNVDIRGDGGYAAAPPSVHPATNRKYEWNIDITEEFAESPLWLLEKMKEEHTLAPLAAGKWESLLSGVPEGERNSSLTAVAGKLLSAHPRQDWEGLVWPLLLAVNAKYNGPLDKVEVRTIFDSIARREMLSKELESNPDGDFELEPWSEFDKIEFPKARWLIEGLIPAGATGIIAAPPKSKKSWVAMDIARSIAEGSDFLGKPEFKTLKSNVIYIEMESPHATLQDRGRQLGLNALSNLYRVKRSLMSLNSDLAVRRLIAHVELHQVGVVIIDTFRSVAGNIPEEKAEEVRKFMSRFKTMKDKGITVLFMDHCRKPHIGDGKIPKVEQLFGSVDKFAAVDFLIMIRSELWSKEISIYPKANKTSIERKPFVALIEDTEWFQGLATKTKLTFLREIGEKDSRDMEAKETARLLIYEYLSSQDGKRTTKRMVDALKGKIGKTAIEGALRDMKDKGEIDWGKNPGSKELLFWTKSNEEDKLKS